jgi:hypothetical protein
MKGFIATALLVLELGLSGFAQTAEETFAAADRAYKVHDYKNAVDLYQRGAFFAGNKFSVSQRLKLARSYALLGQTASAHQLLNTSKALFAPNDSTRVEYLLRQGLVSFLEGDHVAMKYYMLQVATTYGDSQRVAHVTLLASAHQLLGELAEAEVLFLSLSTVDDSDAEQLKEINKRTERYLRKKEVAAFIMSLVVPGLGQAYAGEPVEALNSFLLNGVTYTVYMITMFNIGIIEATILVYPWFLRYYKGGYERARDLLEENKLERKVESLERILPLIE